MAGIPSAKQTLIDKANTTVVIMVSVAAFLAVFSTLATKTLMSQAGYQNRVIKEKRTALQVLKKDIESAKILEKSYYEFVNTTTNSLGGNPAGSGPQDGNNTKIVLDALPSSYDFPALTTSLEALLASQNVKINTITGTDEEVTQSANQSSTTPLPIAIPFQIAIESDYEKVKNVVDVLERSIRPIQALSLDISGTQGKLTLSVSAQTYYQPAKSLNIGTKVVK